MNIRLFAAVLLLLLTSKTYATNFGYINNINFGAGSFSEFMGDVQTTAQGEKNSYDFKPYFSVGMDSVLYKDFSILSDLVLTLPEKGRDENITRFTFMTLVSLGYHYKDFLFKVGTGFTFTRISSDGGTETLQNGNNPSEEFFLPSGGSTSRNLLLSAGIQYYFLKNWSLAATGLYYNLTDSESSSWSSLISVNFHIDEEMWTPWL